MNYWPGRTLYSNNPCKQDVCVLYVNFFSWLQRFMAFSTCHSQNAFSDTLALADVRKAAEGVYYLYAVITHVRPRRGSYFFTPASTLE